MRSSARLLGAALIAAPTLLAHPLAAQFAQYTAPGQPIYEAQSRQEALDGAIENALWHFGRVAIDPWIGLSDLAYRESRNGETGETANEWTGSIGGGLRGYFPIGSKSTLVAFGYQDYSWFQENSDANRFNPKLGLGFFTFLNRLAIELKAQRIEDLGYVTTETDDRVSSRNDSLTADLEIPIGSRISLVGQGALTNEEYDLDSNAQTTENYSDLDSDSKAWSAGLRFYLTETLSITAGYGQSDTEFDDEARDRSNSGDSWGIGVTWRRPKTGASISWRRSNLEPKEGSDFEGFDGETWDAEVSWSPRERFSLGLYSRRNLSYSLSGEDSFFVDERVGLRSALGIGWRFTLTLFAEQGTLDYGEGVDSTSDRRDDLTAWGAELGFPLGRRFRLTAGFRRTEVESEFPGAGYRRDEIVGSFGFGGGGTGARWY